jgi:AraC-like DNA-binding protein
MHEMLVNDIEHHYTLEELSQRFEIPQTRMTSCFKGVYGNTIYAYMRIYRMKYAAKVLLQSQLSVAEVALSVGYVNPSKFSNAFEKVVGTLPNEYRRRKVDNVNV